MCRDNLRLEQFARQIVFSKKLKQVKLAQGIDDRAVVPDREAKSISRETKFVVDIQDAESLRAWLLELTEHVGRRIRRQKHRGRTVNLKLRFADFHPITRAKTLPQATDVTQEIWQAAIDLWTPALASFTGRLRQTFTNSLDRRLTTAKKRVNVF